MNHYATKSDLLRELRYQCLGGISTWGPCSGCKDSARGSRLCRHCLGERLAEFIEPSQAARLVTALSEAGRLLGEAEGA